MKNFFYFILGLGFIAGMTYLFWIQPIPDKPNTPEQTTFDQNAEIVEISTGEGVIYAEVVDTPSQMALGLSGRESLNLNEGMLFVYEELKSPGIWMKDMNFSIDIIWLNEEREVVFIEKDVSPESFPEVFKASEPSMYVLELLAGAVERFSIDIGTVLSWRR